MDRDRRTNQADSAITPEERLDATHTFALDDLNDAQAVPQIAAELEAALEEDSLETLTIDLASLAWLGSFGLNHLISIHREARSRGIRVVLANVQAEVREVLVLTRLERIFELEPLADEDSLQSSAC